MQIKNSFKEILCVNLYSLSTQIILNLHATELLMRNATPPDPHVAVVFNFNLL